MSDNKLIRFPVPHRYWLGLWRRQIEESLDRLGPYLIALQSGEIQVTKVTYIAPADQPIIQQAEPRLFKAPRALVWKCFSQPEHVTRWWGSAKRGTVTIKTFEFRVGGAWRFEHAFHGGGEMTFKGVYRAIEPISRIVNTFGVEGMFDGAELEETHLFSDSGTETLYTSTSRFDTFEARDGMMESGMEDGANESMEQLDELLAELLQHA